MADLTYRPCVGLVIRNRSGRIFTGERFDAPNAWQMPQGGIDAGETTLDAAYRELQEETGIARDHVTLVQKTKDWFTYDLPADLVGKAFKGRYRGQKQQWVLFDFTATESVIQIDQLQPEFSRWRWSPVPQVIRDIVPFKRDLYQQVFTALALL